MRRKEEVENEGEPIPMNKIKLDGAKIQWIRC